VPGAFRLASRGVACGPPRGQTNRKLAADAQTHRQRGRADHPRGVRGPSSRLRERRTWGAPIRVHPPRVSSRPNFSGFNGSMVALLKEVAVESLVEAEFRLHALYLE